MSFAIQANVTAFSFLSEESFYRHIWFHEIVNVVITKGGSIFHEIENNYFETLSLQGSK